MFELVRRTETTREMKVKRRQQRVAERRQMSVVENNQYSRGDSAR